MMPRPFEFYPFFGIDGSILMTNRGDKVATDQDMSWFFRQAEPELDRLTLELCQDERAQGNMIPDWLLQAELDAFKRTRARAAA